MTRTPVRRPGVWVLGLVYLVWIGFPIAIIQMPGKSYPGVFAFMMMLFVWFPYWAYRNWNDLFGNLLPETCATIAIVIGFTAITQLDFWWSFSDAREELRLFLLKSHYPQMEIWRTPRQVKWLDALPEIMRYAVIFSWWAVRNRIAVRWGTSTSLPGRET